MESVEDLVLVILRNAVSVVHDRQCGVAIELADPDLDVVAAVSHCFADQAADYLADSGRVGLGDCRLAGDPHGAVGLDGSGGEHLVGLAM
jgi:fructose-1,6-bisphosphatase/sedoheptulose 1,7-bisphosphatase-like protein